MPVIDLKYGSRTIPFEYDETRFTVLGTGLGRRPLTDAEIGGKLDDPIGSGRLEDLVEPGQSVLIVGPDATR